MKISTNKRYSKSAFIMFACIIGVFVIGLVLGYMLAMQGIYEILNHIQIGEIIVDLNETEITDYIMCKFNETYC